MTKLSDNILNRNQVIKKSYLGGLKNNQDSELLIEELAKEHKIGKFYVRSILKEQRVNIKRKGEYSRKDEKSLQSRNQLINDAFERGDDPEKIAVDFDLTVTRIRQLLKGKISKQSKLPKLNQIKDEIKSKIDNDVPYEKIVAEYGKNTIKQLRYNLDFNVFQIARSHMHSNMVRLIKTKKKIILYATTYACVDKKTAVAAKKILLDSVHDLKTTNKYITNSFVDKVIIGEKIAFLRGQNDLLDSIEWKDGASENPTENMIVDGKVVFAYIDGLVKPTPQSIADVYSVSRHYVYMMLHEHGIRARLPKREIERRNKEIAADYNKDVKIEEIASKNKLTPTMVRIILNKRKADKAERKLATA